MAAELTRRVVLGAGAAFVTLPLLEACHGAGGGGTTLIVAVTSEPNMLTSAFSSAGPAQMISPKIFDGLLGYSRDLQPLPRLAVEWHFTDNDRELTLKLRPGVRWHDGKPFTSADVAYSALQVWKIYHSRGRMTFANLVAVDMPDPLTAVFRFSDPAPYVINAFAANESQVLPRHLYEGRDVLSHPANIAPVGVGPFRFAEWQRGQFIRLERNPNYWDHGKPHLDGVIFRLMGDSAAETAALETGEIHVTQNVSPGDYDRVAALSGVRWDKRLFALITSGSGLEFNLDVPKLQDVRVRRAVAYAIDKSFILANVLHGVGVVDEGPISSIYKDFYTPAPPHYPFDPAKASALLDEAGLRPDARGVRLGFRLAPTPGTTISSRTADYIRSALGKVGIEVRIENNDFPTFVRRVYTDRDFEVILAGGQMGPDPVIGTQRWYWSKSFKPGVAFSNGSHYRNPEADRLLESAQREVDPVKRRALYAGFSQVVMADLPRIPLYSGGLTLFQSARVSPMPDAADGLWGTFSEVKFLD